MSLGCTADLPSMNHNNLLLQLSLLTVSAPPGLIYKEAINVLDDTAHGLSQSLDLCAEYSSQAFYIKLLPFSS